MEIKFNFTILLLALVIILGLLLFKSCKSQKELNGFLDDYELITKDQQAILLDQKERIYKGTVTQVENNKKIKELLDTVAHLKNVKSIIKVVTETKIKEVQVPFEVPVVQDIDGDIYLKTPQPFLKIDKWYTIAGTIKSDGVFFDSLAYRNDFYVATGTQDYGGFFKNLFKRNETIVTIKDNNPYTSTATLYQTTINSPKRKIHIGPNLSAIYNGEKIVPTVGIGVTYSIISF